MKSQRAKAGTPVALSAAESFRLYRSHKLTPVEAAAVALLEKPKGRVQKRKPDPILALVEQVDATWWALQEAIDDADHKVVEQAYRKARNALLMATPTTQAGMRALLDHFGECAQFCAYDLAEVLPMLVRATWKIKPY